VITDNIIESNPTGIEVFLKDENTRARLMLGKNTFWNNAVDTKNCKQDPQSLAEDPGFADPNNGNFSLKPGPVKQQNQGLANPQIFKTLWKIFENRDDKNVPFSTTGISQAGL